MLHFRQGLQRKDAVTTMLFKYLESLLSNQAVSQYGRLIDDYFLHLS